MEQNLVEMIIGKRRFKFVQNKLILLGEGLVWGLKGVILKKIYIPG
jgi:hypothetical protein